MIEPGTTGRRPMSSRWRLTSSTPTAGVAAPSMPAITSVSRSASQVPPRARPSRTTPSPPRFRSTISWAIRVTARRTSSAFRTSLRARKTPPLGGVGAFAVDGDGRVAAARICSSSVQASRDPFHGCRHATAEPARRIGAGPPAPTRSVRDPCTRRSPRGHDARGVRRQAPGRPAPPSSGVGRSLGAMAESMPLTKRPESSVEKRLASSTASSMTTATGTSGRSFSS